MVELPACMTQTREEGGKEEGRVGIQRETATYRIMARQQEGQNLITHVIGRQLLARLRVRGGEHESQHVLLVCSNALLQLCLSLRDDLIDELNVGLIESTPFFQEFTCGQHLRRGGEKNERGKCERRCVGTRSFNRRSKRKKTHTRYANPLPSCQRVSLLRTL